MTVSLHNPLDGESMFFAFEIPEEVPPALFAILPSDCAKFIQSSSVSPTRATVDGLRRSLSNHWSQSLDHQYCALFWYYKTLGLPYDMTGVYFRDAVDLFTDVFLCRTALSTPREDIQTILEKYRNRSHLSQESRARQSHIQRQPMHALGVLAEEMEDADDTDDTDHSDTEWEIENDYFDSDEEFVEEPDPVEPVERSSPPSKRRRVDSQPEELVSDFRTPREATDHDLCVRWATAFCRVLPGLHHVAQQYMKTKVLTLDYVSLCQALRRTYLAEGLKYSKPKNLHQAKRRATGWLLKGMKSIKAQRYDTREWRHAVFDSGLAAVMMCVGDPNYVVGLAKGLDNENDIVDVFRHQRLQDSLTVLLLKWTPSSLSLSWTPHTLLFKAVRFDKTVHDAKRRISKPSQFRKALTDTPWLLPRAAIPETVFFLHSLENFLRIYDMWIGPALEAGGYDLDTIGDDAKTRGHFYALMMQYLLKDTGEKYRKGHYDHTNTLEVIFARLIEAKDMEKEYATFLRRNIITKGELLEREKKGEVLYQQVRSCRYCCNRVPEQQCTQVVYVTRRLNIDHMTGCGISHCPKRRENPVGTSKVYNPDELKLRAIRSDPDIIARCNRQIFYIVDTNRENIPVYSEQTAPDFVDVPVLDNTGKLVSWKHEYVMDGIFFQPFSQRVLEKQRHHERNMRYMSPLRRGAKFANYSEGDMYGGGAGRQGKGGALGDGYSYYARMEAQSIKGIHALMDIAEDAFFLECVAAFAFRGLWKKIRDTVKMTDHIGMSGLNVFRCSDYVAPLHRDKDASRGFCCTIRWRGIRALDEFAFCQPEWGYYIATESNLFWTFDSRHLHGTMLPSSETPSTLDGDPLDSIDQHIPSNSSLLPTQVRQPASNRIPVPVAKRASSGYHQTDPEKNVSAAQRYDRAVHLRPDLHLLWRDRANLD